LTGPTEGGPSVRARPSLRVRVVGYLVIAIILCGALAIGWVPEMRSIQTLMARNAWPHGAFLPDAELGFRPARDFSGTMLDHSFHVHTDTVGSRIPANARPDVIEPHGLLAVGCSFTYGYEVEAEQAFPYVIGRALEIPSYNFGVCAYSYVTAILLLKQLERDGTLTRLAPQFLVLGAGSWLEDRSRSPFYPTDTLPFTYPYLRKQDATAVVARAPSVIDARHAFTAAESATGNGNTPPGPAVLAGLVPRVWFARIYSRTMPDPGSQATLADEALYEFVVGELAALAHAHDMRLAILWLPHHEVEALNPKLAQIVSKHPDVILVDGNESMRRERVNAKEFADRHPSAVAHGAYGRHVAEVLRPLKRTE
jgi:hypothetical protein